MTTWDGLKDFVNAQYQIEELSEHLLKVIFNTGNLRTQVAFIEFAGNETGVAWVKMTSPIGRVADIDLRVASEKLAEMIFGGLVVAREWVYVTNGMPLQDLDPNEVTETLGLLVGIADGLEKELLERDAV